MKQIDLRQVIDSRAPQLFSKFSPSMKDKMIRMLEKIIKVDRINYVLKNYKQTGFEFIEEFFDYLNFVYLVSNMDKKKIPAQGRLICVANHPLGALDGLALLNTIGEIRHDVRIVANDLLLNLENLSELFLPYDIFSPSTQKKNIKNIDKALENNEAVIFFPSAQVSRISLKGIYDRKWRNGAIRFARKFNCTVLPVHISARNSLFFYLSALINKSLPTVLLPREMFKRKHRKTIIRIGDPIPGKCFAKERIIFSDMNEKLRKHVYNIGKGKKEIFTTQKNIVHPIDSKLLLKELEDSELLGEINGGKRIFLVKYDNAKNVLKEIGRLREHTFRSVGEGTGKYKDFDVYDKYYKHIVLWNDKELEIIGSYRLGEAKVIIEEYGVNGLYNSDQFIIKESFIPLLKRSVELGRSFIQRKYWRSKALDYLWQGVGSYLTKNPEIEYLYGAVSISDSYSEQAREMIVYYYNKWYKDNRNLVEPRVPFIISKDRIEEYRNTFSGKDHIKDLRNLKIMLRNSGYSIPVLFRKYTELCEYGGAKFHAFTINEGFSKAVDGLIVIDLKKIKSSKKERYYTQKSFVEKVDLIQN